MILDIKLIQKSVLHEGQEYSQYFVLCQFLFSKLCFTISNIYTIAKYCLAGFFSADNNKFPDIPIYIVSIIVRDSPKKKNNVKNGQNLVYNRKSIPP